MFAYYRRQVGSLNSTVLARESAPYGTLRLIDAAKGHPAASAKLSVPKVNRGSCFCLIKKGINLSRRDRGEGGANIYKDAVASVAADAFTLDSIAVLVIFVIPEKGLVCYCPSQKYKNTASPCLDIPYSYLAPTFSQETSHLP